MKWLGIVLTGIASAGLLIAAVELGSDGTGGGRLVPEPPREPPAGPPAESRSPMEAILSGALAEAELAAGGAAEDAEARRRCRAKRWANYPDAMERAARPSEEGDGR